MIKDKNKESKIEANLTRVIITQSGSTSHVGGSDSDSTVFSFSVITPTIGYSGESESMLDTGAAIMWVTIGINFLALRS